MFIIDCEVYPFQILVYFGDKKGLRKELKKYDKSFIKEVGEIKQGKTVIFSTGQTLLWLKHKPKSINDLSLLSHEIFHCTCFILNRCGIQLSDSSDEAFAYLIQYLTKQIYNELNLTFSWTAAV